MDKEAGAEPDEQVKLHFILEVSSDLSIGTKMTAKEGENNNFFDKYSLLQ